MASRAEGPKRVPYISLFCDVYDGGPQVRRTRVARCSSSIALTSQNSSRGSCSARRSIGDRSHVARVEEVEGMPQGLSLLEGSLKANKNRRSPNRGSSPYFNTNLTARGA